MQSCLSFSGMDITGRKKEAEAKLWNFCPNWEKAFGKATHSVKDNLYHWNTGKVSLTFGSVAKKKVQLVYYAHGIKAIMKADANQKIEDLSTEF